MKIRITLIEEMLGTKAANPNVFADFIASKHPSGTPQKDELDNAEHREEAGTTVFHRQEGRIGIYDYQVKGFFKAAIGALNRCDKKTLEQFGLSEQLAAFKTKIDGLVFVGPRFIPLTLPTGATVGICERPLRAETAQGPRVSLCRSETVPAGTILECEVTLLNEEAMKAYVRAALAYGKLRGLGQWRNSGKGRFEWEELG